VGRTLVQLALVPPPLEEPPASPVAPPVAREAPESSSDATSAFAQPFTAKTKVRANVCIKIERTNSPDWPEHSVLRVTPHPIRAPNGSDPTNLRHAEAPLFKSSRRKCSPMNSARFPSTPAALAKRHQPSTPCLTSESTLLALRMRNLWATFRRSS
jgi:hypothetical protein